MFASSPKPSVCVGAMLDTIVCKYSYRVCLNTPSGYHVWGMLVIGGELGELPQYNLGKDNGVDTECFSIIRYLTINVYFLARESHQCVEV